LRVQKRKLPSASTKRMVPSSKRPVRARPIIPRKKIDKKVYIIGGAVLLIAVLVVFLVLLIPNLAVKSDSEEALSKDVGNSAESQNKNTVAVDIEGFAVNFGEVKINGTSEAILFGEYLSEKNGQSELGFEVLDEQENIVFDSIASLLDGGMYVKVKGLFPETNYTVKAYCLESGEKTFAEKHYSFSTPKRQMSLKQVEKLIEETCPRSTESMSDENKILYQAHACMELLGMEFDLYERMEALTQVNQVMLDYSLNSYNSFVFWNEINERPTKESVALLKDIISVNPNIKKNDILRDFVVSPYSMTKYSKYDKHGGQISSEDYVFDMMQDDDSQIKGSEDARVYFQQLYPYIVDSPEFQDLYASLINGEIAEDSEEMDELKKQFGKEPFDQPKDVMLEAIAAKNKVLFADIMDWWLDDIAILPEKRIYLYSESGRHSLDSVLAPAMVAYAYMYDEYREETGKELTVNNSYRSRKVQWDKYSKGYGKSQVFDWSGFWHFQRQNVSYVPGYSNHQFAVAIDFQPAQYAFINSTEYAYLEKNANRYGFYNYSLEPWHWTYLGEEIPKEIMDSTPLSTPLPEE